MNLKANFWTQSDAIHNSPIVPQGIMVHSTATPGVMAQDFRNRWNKPGLGKSVHAFLDDQVIVQCLPWNIRAGHAGRGTSGRTANDTHIGFEICEPLRWQADETYFRNIFKHAAELCVHLCRMFGLTEANILDHSGGYRAGIASNHADVMHWFPKFGEDMHSFRAAVRRGLGQSPPAVNVTLARVLRHITPMMEGNDIRAVQTRLIELGYTGNMQTPNGVFGWRTAESVKAFQRDKALTADGIVGRETATALEFTVHYSANDVQISRLLYLKTPMMEGNDIKMMQTRLFELGYHDGMQQPNGMFGPRTKEAVQNFQRARGLPVDGIVGEKTALALGGTWK